MLVRLVRSDQYGAARYELARARVLRAFVAEATGAPRHAWIERAPNARARARVRAPARENALARAAGVPRGCEASGGITMYNSIHVARRTTRKRSM
jgi:hypothetical protein